MVFGKLFHNEALDTFSFGNHRVYIDPDCKYIIAQARAMSHKRDRRIHIFLTNVRCVRTKEFIEFMESLFQEVNQEPVVTIHVSYEMEDLKKYLHEIVFPSMHTEYVPKIRVFCERKPVLFLMDGARYRKWLKFEWINNQLRVYYELDTYPLRGYQISNKGKPGAIRNTLQRNYPELYKDKIIQNFKESCPEKILKNFTSDDDIWDYIMQEGEWES